MNYQDLKAIKDKCLSHGTGNISISYLMRLLKLTYEGAEKMKKKLELIQEEKN